MKRVIVLLIALAVLAVNPVVFAATIYIDDGLSHTFDASFDNHGDNVILRNHYAISNSPLRHPLP